MAVFSGADPRNLTLVAENDDSPTAAPASEVTFRSVVGRVYTIVVDSVGDTSGAIALAASVEPDEGDGPLFLPTATVTPSITFTENYSDSLRSDGFGGFEQVGTDRISAVFTAPLDQVDISGLDESTPVSVTIGAFAFEGTLGQDPTYSPGKSVVNFPLTDSATERRVGSVVVSWTERLLTIRINSANTIDHTIDYASYSDNNPAIRGKVEAVASFAGVAGRRDVYVTGRSRLTPSRDFELLSVSLNGTADYIAPNVAVTIPTVTADTATLALNGTLADAWAVGAVTVQINDEEPVEATVTPNEAGTNATWTVADLPLAPGRNVVVIRGTDESGNATVLTRNVVRPRLGPIALVTDGQGTITGSFSGTLLQLGESYAVTATPANGWLFRGWVSNSGLSSTTPRFSFVMTEGLQLTARFIRNPFANLGGSYRGFARSSNGLPGDTGAVTVDVLPTGSFTASFFLGTRRTSVSGTFDDTGRFTRELPARVRNGPPIVLTLQLDVTGGSEQITGTITDGTFVSGVTSDRLVFSPAAATPLAGRYTVALSNATDLRGTANGFLTLTVSPDGAVRATGVVSHLNAAPAIGGSGFISRSGVVQLYDPLASGAGVAVSLSFAPVEQGTVTGAASWYRPNLGTLDLPARGEVFVAPPVGTRVINLSNGLARFEIGGTGLTTATVQNFTIPADNRVAITPLPTGLNVVTALTIDTRSGVFSFAGRRNGQRISGQGVFLQKSGFGAASYLSGGAAGHLLILPR